MSSETVRPRFPIEAWIYACFYSFILLRLDVWFGFHIGLNDFWGAYYQADNLDFHNPETLYNGFFPIGYPVLVWLAPGDDFVEAGFAIAVVSRLVLVGLFGTIAAQYLPAAWAMAATAAYSIIPRIFENVLTPGADLPMMTLALAGGLCYVRTDVEGVSNRRRWILFVAGGALFGLAGLVRQHALVFAAGTMLGAIILRPRDIGRVAVSGLACTLAYSPQFAVNIAAHRGLFETCQYVNIYKIIHGLKELRTIPLDLKPDVVEIVSADPLRFVLQWFRQFVGMFPLIVPVLVATFYRREPALRRFAILVAFAALPYLVITATAWSARAVLLVIPWVVIVAACLAYQAQIYIAKRVGLRALLAFTMAVIGIFSAGWAARQNALLVRWYLQAHHYYSLVERTVAADGVVHPKQVYTTDGTLYLPMMAPHWPYFDGTWGQFSLYKLAERYPRLNVSNLRDFRDECNRQGITHVVLDGNSGWVSPALLELFLHPKAHPEFDLVGYAGPYAVFRRR